MLSEFIILVCVVNCVVIGIKLGDMISLYWVKKDVGFERNEDWFYNYGVEDEEVDVGGIEMFF